MFQSLLLLRSSGDLKPLLAGQTRSTQVKALAESWHALQKAANLPGLGCRSSNPGMLCRRTGAV